MESSARILDANANRAREALRVLEDLARFHLSDSELTARLKRLRHDLTSAMRALPLDDMDLLAARDTAQDVGVEISTPQEGKRADHAAVAAAAGGRLGEALRSLEEHAKLLDAPAAAATFQSLRYLSYQVQQRVVLALKGAAAPQWTVGVLLTEDRCRLPWFEVARQAVAAGATYLQLREKKLTDRELLTRIRALVELARSKRVAVIVNDRADLAMLARADGVHVGQTDLPAEDIRRLVGTRLLVGVSAANLLHARAAVLAGADYLGLGPMFPSTTKPKDVLSGPGLVSAVLGDETTRGVPHLAISGISRSNLPQLRAVGCRGIAVSSAVCGAADPGAAVADLVAAMARAEAPAGTSIF